MTSRACGLLLHLTSLPGRFDGGSLGREAHRFLAQLAESGIGWWQTLPVGPPGYGGSPYDSPSAFAGSTELISPPENVDSAGLERREQLRDLYVKESSSWRKTRAAEQFLERESFWLQDHAAFVALSARFESVARQDWPLDVRTREGEAVADARRQLSEEIDFECWLQFQFSQQWAALRRAAREHQVRLIGDMPIFVASHSADVWAHPELFELDRHSQPTEVAAVPPDAFTDSGQLWGNPVYRWPSHRKDTFSWWRKRVATSLRRFDLLRIDHFRGFVANWRVPAGSETAVEGRWARGPGMELWQAFEDDPQLPLESCFEGRAAWPTLFAEDLGHITRAVRRFLRETGLWGTRVLQFTDRKTSEHHPHNQSAGTVYYTGTHDNDTTRGWLDSLGHDYRKGLPELFGIEEGLPPEQQVRALVQTALESKARLTVLPLQDVLGQGSEARMNLPGTSENNWRYRAPEGLLDESAAAWLSDLLSATGRHEADR